MYLYVIKVTHLQPTFSITCYISVDISLQKYTLPINQINHESFFVFLLIKLKKTQNPYAHNLKKS